MSLVTVVRTRLNEATAAFWPDQQVYDALNEALLEVYARTKFAYATSTLSIVNNDDIVALPITVYIPQRIINDTTGEKPMATQARLERYNRGWRQFAHAEPTHFVHWDSEHVRCFPFSNASYSYTVTGINYPPAEISATNLDIASLPVLVRRALEFLASAILIAATMPNVADEWYKQADTHIYNYLEQKRNNQSHNIRRMRPMKKWQKVLGGDISLLGRF